LQAPLPFYPKTAWAWLEGKSGWRTAWVGLPYQQRPGEQDDPYVQLRLRDRADDPLGAAFQAMAARIFAPLRTAIASLSAKVGDD
jgi:exodeoxyribonuclease V gamma subunit